MSPTTSYQALFDDVYAGVRGATPKPMFGWRCYFVDGNLAAGLKESEWNIRLSPDDEARLLRIAGAKPFMPMPGKVMAGYVILPASIVQNRKELDRWVAKSIEFVRSLPPRKPRPGRR